MGAISGINNLIQASSSYSTAQIVGRAQKHMGMEKDIISSEIKKDGFSTASKSKRLGEIEDQTQKTSQLLTDALQTSDEQTQKAAEECAGNDNISEDSDSSGTGEDSGVSASSGDGALSQAFGSQSLSASTPHLDVRA